MRCILEAQEQGLSSGSEGIWQGFLGREGDPRDTLQRSNLTEYGEVGDSCFRKGRESN